MVEETYAPGHSVSYVATKHGTNPSAICDPDEARRYLRHVGLPSDPPARAPPHYMPVVMVFDAGPAVDASTEQMTSPGWE